MTDRYYPTEICFQCGIQHGRPRHSQAVGAWMGKCGWCGKEGPVCSPRDYLYPEFKGQPPADWKAED